MNSQFQEAWKSISPYFTPEEMFSPDTRFHLNFFDRAFLIKFNKFRSTLTSPLYVNTSVHRLRGARSAAEQMELVADGLTTAISSRHCQGKAADISSRTIPPKELAVLAVGFGFHGVGLYEDRGFVHIDNRDLISGDPVVWGFD